MPQPKLGAENPATDQAGARLGALPVHARLMMRQRHAGLKLLATNGTGRHNYFPSGGVEGLDMDPQTVHVAQREATNVAHMQQTLVHLTVVLHPAPVRSIHLAGTQVTDNVSHRAGMLVQRVLVDKGALAEQAGPVVVVFDFVPLE